MVEFSLGFCIGVLLSVFFAIYWGHRLSVKEEQLNKELIRDFQDRFMETQEQKFYKRFES
tara:strand:+ start:158 stop:337 length:180 start_codon:yes stop_codon:yes gene_type:complete